MESCFCVNKMFPHPNYDTKMGKSDQPVFLKTFPEVKVDFNKWANLNITNLNFEIIGIKLKQNILPNTYKTYLQEVKLNNHQLTYSDFQKLFHLISISHSTIFKWMKYLGFNFCETRRNYYCDKHEEQSNVEYREPFTKKILSI